MSKVMISLVCPGEVPTLAEIKRRYHLNDGDVDAGFGVIPVDPASSTFTILVEENVAAKVSGDSRWKTSEPFSNPRIATFELPTPDQEAPSTNESNEGGS